MRKISRAFSGSNAVVADTHRAFVHFARTVLIDFKVRAAPNLTQRACGDITARLCATRLSDCLIDSNPVRRLSPQIARKTLRPVPARDTPPS